MDEFREDKDGRPRYTNHSYCAPECEYAKRFDIDSSFMDFLERDQVIPPPTDSPALQIARSAGRQTRFESTESLAEARALQKAVKLLHAGGVYAKAGLIGAIASHASNLSADPKCPRYWEPWYVAHAAHKLSGSACACPCSSCVREEKRLAHVDLSALESPHGTI